MAVKKGLSKGLGKGIDLLIPDDETPVVSKKTTEPKIVEKIVEKEVIVKEPAEIRVDINLVEPNREQPRTLMQMLSKSWLIQ